MGNLLVAGLTMANSFMLSSALRMHPIEWTTGTAAGVSAAFMRKEQLRRIVVGANKKAGKRSNITRTGNKGSKNSTPVCTTADVLASDALMSALQVALRRHTPLEWVINGTRHPALLVNSVDPATIPGRTTQGR